MKVTGEIQRTQRICPCPSPTTKTGLGLNLGLDSKRLARISHYNTVTSTLPAASCLLPFVSLKELLAVSEIILLPDDAASSAVPVLPVAFPPTLSKQRIRGFSTYLTTDARNMATTSSPAKLLCIRTQHRKQNFSQQSKLS